jgi:hypothetical protein
MACRLDRALRNIIYWLEVTTPTSTLVRNRFESYDPNRRDCPLDSAGLRKFWVEWMGSGGDLADADGATDMDNRESNHVARLHVEYPTAPLELTELQCLIASDRHDIRKALRDPAKFTVGYRDNSGTYATTDTGVFNRWFTGDEINKIQRDKWRFTSQLQFSLRESEQ